MTQVTVTDVEGNHQAAARRVGDGRSARQFEGDRAANRLFGSHGYLGTLEVTQDVGTIRALEGERRLLEYAERAAAGIQ